MIHESNLCIWLIYLCKSFQILGTNIGAVLVYKLKKEYYCSEKAEVDKEIHEFIKYIKLL